MEDTSLIKKQTWMADDEAFLNVKKRITEVKNLTSKYKDHPYVDELMKEWKVDFVYGKYILEGEIDSNFSSSERQYLLQNTEPEPSQSERPFRRRMINGMRALKYLQDQIDNDLTIMQIKEVHEMIMHEEKDKNGKDLLVGEYRNKPVFAGFKVFAPVSAIEWMMSEALERYHSSKDEPILAATNLFVDLINIHPFEDGNGRLCRMILSHVLMQRGCSLFPVLLNSFKKRGSRHYIQAVKKSYENPTMLYTMVAVSLVYVWDIFEQRVAHLDSLKVVVS